jgi:hypothetical protein
LKRDTACPTLHSLLFEARRGGITLDFETLLSELSKMWSDATKSQFEPERVRTLISGYFPVASEIKREEESMPSIFESARNFVANEVI